MIDPELRDMIEPKLQNGETLLWATASNTRQINRIALIPVVVILAFLGYFIVSHYKTNQDFIGPFLLPGIMIIPFIIWALSPRWEKHFLTNRRIIVQLPFAKMSNPVNQIKTIKIAPWAGKNCISISMSEVVRIKGIPVAGAWGLSVLHGVIDPEEFIRFYHYKL